MNDPELEELFAEPAEREVVELLKASRPAAPPLDPHFRNYLRAKLMTEARRTLPARASRSWLPFRLSPKTMAPAMAAVAAGFLVVLGVEIYLHGQTTAPEIAQANIGAINNKKARMKCISDPATMVMTFFGYDAARYVRGSSSGSTSSRFVIPRMRL